MSKEITIVYEAPVIFTKDKMFLQKINGVKPGSIILLPEDAVLYVPETTVTPADEPFSIVTTTVRPT